MSIIHETESQLVAFSPSKRLIVMAMTALMVVALGWYGWIEPLQEKIETKQMACEELEQKIASIDLRRILHKLHEVKKERLRLQESLHDAEAAKRYLQSRTSHLDFLWFEQKSFLEMLDRVLKRSVELGLRIDLIESRDEKGEVSPLIEKKKVVRIDGAGAFAQIVKLVHYIESFNALLKVERVWISLSEQGETIFHLDLLSYGANL